jgi:F-type H+-transporting ATPase subunit b
MMDVALASLQGGGLLEDLGINPKVLGTQVVIFVITFLALSRILFRRVLDQMTRREGEIRAAREALERDRAELARRTAEYEERLARADKEGYDRTQALLKEALLQAQASVARAQEEARRLVEQARADVLAEKRRALEQIRTEAARLSMALAEKVIEAPLDPTVYGPRVRAFLGEGK